MPREEVQLRLPETRVEELLDAAAKVFLEKGFEQATMLEIAKRSNSSKGTFYNRYPTKESLFAAVMQRGANRVEAELAGLVVSSGDVRHVLRYFSMKLLEIVLHDETLELYRLAVAQARRFPELGKAFYESGPGRMITVLAEYLRGKADQGVLAIASPEAAAEQFIDMVTGMLLRRAVLGIGDRPSSRERTQRIEAAVATFLAAYSADDGDGKNRVP